MADEKSTDSSEKIKLPAMPKEVEDRTLYLPWFIVDGNISLVKVPLKAFLLVFSEFPFPSEIPPGDNQLMINQLAEIEYLIPMKNVVPNYDAIKNSEMKERARKELKKLCKHTISIDKANGNLKEYNIVTTAEFVEKTHIIIIKLSIEIIPLILQMKSKGHGFTQVPYSSIFYLNSHFSIWMEILCYKVNSLRHVKEKGFRVKVPCLKVIVGLEDGKYRNNGNFVIKVVHTAYKELTKFSGLTPTFEYEKISLGRIIDSIRIFDIVIPNDKLLTSARVDLIDVEQKNDRRDCSIEAEKHLELIFPKQRKVILSKYTPEYICHYYESSKKKLKAGIVNEETFNGFFYKQLIDDPDDFENLRKTQSEIKRTKAKRLKKKEEEEQREVEKLKVEKEEHQKVLKEFRKLSLEEQEKHLRERFPERPIKFLNTETSAILVAHDLFGNAR